MSDALPSISQATIDHVFKALMTMEVELDENPLQYGPRRLNQKTAKARGFLTECEALFLKVSRWLQVYKAAARAAETSLELGKKHLLANDPEVRAGRNVADRDALASIKLRSEVEELSRIQGIQADLETLMTVIKAKRSDLRDVQGRLRDQIRLCQEEIALGTPWGSRPPPGRKGPDLDKAPNVDKKSLRDLQEMFSGVDVEEESLADAVKMEIVSDAPKPKLKEEDGDLVNADSLLADFGHGSDEEVDEEEVDEEEVDEEEPKAISDFPRIGYCGICGQPQYETPSGPSCENMGHGGAETLDEPFDPNVPDPVAAAPDDVAPTEAEIEETRQEDRKATKPEPDNSAVAPEAASTLDALLSDDLNKDPEPESEPKAAATSIDELLGTSDPESDSDEEPEEPAEEPVEEPEGKNIMDLLDGIESEPVVAPEAKTKPKKKDLDVDALLNGSGVAKDSDADEVLSEIDTPTPKKKDVDIDSLLGDLGL